ncbi:thioredoxin [Firmicutes bacterium CAG:884]|nr:thioredoxin [Firmicutes bacterium CAG:884]
MVKLIKTEEEFNREIMNDKVVVDFFANWCGPCKMLAPIVEEVSNELEKITFIKVDIDEIESLPRQFDIMSIPTLLVFEKGELIKRHTGYIDKDELVQFIK